MKWLFSPFIWFWDTALNWPMERLRQAHIYDAPEGWPTHLIKAGILLFMFLAVAETYVRIRDRRRRKHLREMRLTGRILEPEDAYTKADNVFGDQLDAAKNPEKTVRMLKARKDYTRLGEVYAGLNRPDEAAKWFTKAGDHARAGAEYAKAGQTKRAADALAKAGDHVSAARFYVEVGEWKKAAASYEALGATAEAAFALFRAGKHPAAVDRFNAYFTRTTDGAEAQVKAARMGLALLGDAKAVQRVTPEAANALRVAVARRLYRTAQHKQALQLFQQAGVRPPAR